MEKDRLFPFSLTSRVCEKGGINAEKCLLLKFGHKLTAFSLTAFAHRAFSILSNIIFLVNFLNKLFSLM